MKKLLVAAVFITTVLGCAKKDFQPEEENVFTLTSNFTGNNYEIKVLLPQNYDSSKDYPTVYLLDGYYHFADLSKSIHKNEANLILIGLFYKDYPFSSSNIGKIEELREKDLTFPKHIESSGKELGGGAIEFQKFISLELIPQIESEYSVQDSNRTIMGHSLGGYFALWQMFHNQSNPVFQNVVALSPSIWWADLHLLDLEENNFQNDSTMFNSLYLGIAEHEGLEMNVLSDEFKTRLNVHSNENMIFTFQRYSGGHVHSPRKAFYSAIKYLFP